MILSDEHRLAFVHIPKCAGVSIKQPLRPLDSTGGQYSRIGDHPLLGRIHFAHIPLTDLAEHFPDDWAKLRAYRSFAVLRDPRERFLSAMFQRLREFRGANQSDITPARVEQEAASVIAYLESGPARLDLEHVHFNRQCDYVFRDGERIVQDLFAIENMGAITAYVADRTGIAIAEERRNRSTELRLGALRPVVRLLRRPYAAIIPYAARNRLRARMTRAGLYGQATRQPMIRPGGHVDGFIRDYYAQDFALHAAVRF